MRKVYDKNHVLYRNQAFQAAKDLHYGDEVLKQICNAKTNNEIEHIMVNARTHHFNYVY